MILIALTRFRKKATKEFLDEASKAIEGFAKDGVKILASYWTLGEYDSVYIYEPLT